MFVKQRDLHYLFLYLYIAIYNVISWCINVFLLFVCFYFNLHEKALKKEMFKSHVNLK